MTKDQYITAIQERIKAEHRKHSTLDWSRIAAGKVYKGFIEPLLKDENGDK